MRINIKKLNKRATIPTYGSDYSAGVDLYALIDEGGSLDIPPHSTVKVGTGIAMEIPIGNFGGIFARSGLAAKQGLRPANCVGVIDSDYRGEIPPQRESFKDYRRITCEKGKYLAKQPQILRNEPTSSQKTMNQTVKTMHRIALVFAMESCMKNA